MINVSNSGLGRHSIFISSLVVLGSVLIAILTAYNTVFANEKNLKAQIELHKNDVARTVTKQDETEKKVNEAILKSSKVIGDFKGEIGVLKGQITILIDQIRIQNQLILNKQNSGG